MILRWTNKSNFREAALNTLGEMLDHYAEQQIKQVDCTDLEFSILKLGSNKTRCECSAILEGKVNGKSIRKFFFATYQTKQDKQLIGMILGGAIGTLWVIESIAPSTEKSDTHEEENNVNQCMRMISYQGFDFLNDTFKVKPSKSKIIWKILNYSKWIIPFSLMLITFFYVRSFAPRDASLASKISIPLFLTVILGGLSFLLLHLFTITVMPNSFYLKEYLGRGFVLRSTYKSPIHVRIMS